MRAEHPRKQTVDLCYHKEADGSPCSEKVMWKLKCEGTNKAFKVCDVHLAWGLRLSGLPARVDAFIPNPPEES